MAAKLSALSLSLLPGGKQDCAHGMEAGEMAAAWHPAASCMAPQMASCHAQMVVLCSMWGHDVARVTPARVAGVQGVHHTLVHSTKECRFEQ
eukprot:352987-Chlamydomonas_euryale.AAC.22